MTDISKLGEFGLIHHLTDNIKTKNESTIKGVGDDCAVLHYPDSEVLVTTDMLMEGVHFDLTYIDMQHLGYKSAMVNISDIFAMNGTPRQLTVSLALSKRFKVEDMEQFYSGLRMACEKWGVDIVGGDTTSSYTGLAISITCIGEARKEEIVYRNGAKAPNISNLAHDISTSRATVMNYIKYLSDARLINMIYNPGDEFPKKPAKIMMHNPNLLYAIYPIVARTQEVMETFFVNTLWKDHKVHQTGKDACYMVDDDRCCRIVDAAANSRLRNTAKTIYAEYNTPSGIGRDNHVPLWLFGLLY